MYVGRGWWSSDAWLNWTKQLLSCGHRWMHNLVSVTSAPSNEHEKVSFRWCLTTEFVLRRAFIYVCSNVFQCIVRVSEKHLRPVALILNTWDNKRQAAVPIPSLSGKLESETLQVFYEDIPRKHSTPDGEALGWVWFCFQRWKEFVKLILKFVPREPSPINLEK